MASRIHLEYDVEINGRHIRIMGIKHGHYKQPLGEKISKIIAQKAAKNPQHTIYAERATGDFLPRHLISKAVELESEAERITQVQIALGLDELRGSSIPHSKLPPITLPHLGRALNLAAAQYGTEAELATKYIGTFRSAQMAKTLLAAPHSNIIVVVGGSHAEEIKKFLENKKLLDKYMNLWRSVELSIKQTFPHGPYYPPKETGFLKLKPKAPRALP